MRRETWELPAPMLGEFRTVVVYGHWGAPVLFFPAERGGALDLEAHGVIDELAAAIGAGRIHVYAVDGYDSESWANASLPLEDRARAHNRYHDWVVQVVVPAIHRDCGGPVPVVAAGASMGAFLAVNAALRRPDLFPHAFGMSGNYDPTTWDAWGEPGDEVYENNPMAFVPDLTGEELLWLRENVFIDLAVGRSRQEVEETEALPSALALDHELRTKGVPHRLDVWGEDTRHDWRSWRRMAARHLSGRG